MELPWGTDCEVETFVAEEGLGGGWGWWSDPILGSLNFTVWVPRLPVRGIQSGHDKSTKQSVTGANP
jgi:hypothetical protein